MQVNSNLSDFNTWQVVSIGTPSSGTIVEGSIARYNKKLKLGYISIQLNGNSDNTTIKLGMYKTGSIEAPFYAYDSYSDKVIRCGLNNNTIKILNAAAVTRMFLIFPASIE